MMNKLAAVVSQVESAGFPYAQRYEPGVFAGFAIAPAAISAAATGNHCSAVTARVLCSISFGLFQIMGFNLYGFLGWKQSVATFLYDTEQQLSTFADFCQHSGVNPATFDFTDEAQLEHFARVYNGPGDIPNYVSKMKAALAALPPEV